MSALKLYDHQKCALARMTEHDRFLLLMEQGTGKTLSALIALSNLYLAGEIEDALIVAPLSGLGAWKRDVGKLSPERQALIRRGTTFINFDKISRKDSAWQKKLWRNWGCIIVDEGHALSNPTSNRTQFFVGKGNKLGLASKARYFYLLTGTLITNGRLEDLWSPLRAILGEDWMTWGEFKGRFLVTRQLPGSYAEIVVGYRHRQDLLDLVAQHSYRVLKADCLDLPEKLPDEVITVPWADGVNPPPLGKTSKALYEDALESYVEGLDMVADNPLTRMLRLRQIASGHIKETDTVDERGRKVAGEVYTLNSLKTKYAVEIIENNLPHKYVVFHNFKASGRALEKALAAKKIPYVALNGEQKDKNIWQKFQADDSIKVAVVQYQSGSTAIDLFAASAILYLEPTDSSTTLEQSRDRIHRPGQLNHCSYTFLLTEGSIECDMYENLKEYRDFDEKMYRDIARARLTGGQR